MMLASMQRLAKKPSAFAIYGAVCTTLGGATATPTLILRCGPAQVCAEAGVARTAPRMKAAAIAACVRSVGMGRSSLLLLILRRHFWRNGVGQMFACMSGRNEDGAWSQIVARMESPGARASRPPF